MEIVQLMHSNIETLNIEKYKELLSQLSDTLSGDRNEIIGQLLRIIDASHIFILGSLEDPKGSITFIIEDKIIKDFGKVMHIEDFVIDKELRSVGAGSFLLKKSTEFAKTMGCYKVMLHCSEEVKDFYKINGFKEVVGMRIDL